jgi:hypothetical protein
LKPRFGGFFFFVGAKCLRHFARAKARARSPEKMAAQAGAGARAQKFVQTPLSGG